MEAASPLMLRGEYATLGAALGAAARQFGERDAYIEGERHLSFAQWLRDADALAAALAARGVGRGDVIAIALDSSIDFAVAFAAAQRLGAVATGLNPRLGPNEFRGILERCKPAVVVIEDGSGAPALALESILIGRGELRRLVALGARIDSPLGRATDPAVIVWTSGTTGLPRGAWFEHRQMRAVVDMSGPLAMAGDRRLVPTPFAHSGYMTKVWEQLAYAMALVIAPTPWRADEMLRLMVAERITVAGGVPTQWARLIELPQLAQADLGALRLCVTATAPAAPEMLELAMRRLAAPFIVRYAMTESPAVTGTRPGDAPRVMVETVGRPQAGVELALVDERGDPVAPGSVGRVRIRSKCLMRGYWQDPQATAQALDSQGWLISGDLGRLDSQGNLVLVGRVSDMYIRGGYNVYPLEVEKVLAEHPEVAQVSIVGVATPVIGEIGVAFVVPRSTAQPPALAALRSWCSSRLADYKSPDQLELVAELPLTAMLKVDKVALRKRLQPAATRGSPRRDE